MQNAHLLRVAINKSESEYTNMTRFGETRLGRVVAVSIFVQFAKLLCT